MKSEYVAILGIVLICAVSIGGIIMIVHSQQPKQEEPKVESREDEVKPVEGELDVNVRAPFVDVQVDGNLRSNDKRRNPSVSN